MTPQNELANYRQTGELRQPELIIDWLESELANAKTDTDKWTKFLMDASRAFMENAELRGALGDALGLALTPNYEEAIQLLKDKVSLTRLADEFAQEWRDIDGVDSPAARYRAMWVAANMAQGLLYKDNERLKKELAASSDNWSEIVRIAEAIGIGPDESLRSENASQEMWSYNDPCDGRLFHEDEVVDQIIERIKFLYETKSDPEKAVDNWKRMYNSAHDSRVDLFKENEALLLDKRRLDWLSEECHAIEHDSSRSAVVRAEDGRTFFGNNLRDAIDAAIRSSC